MSGNGLPAPALVRKSMLPLQLLGQRTDPRLLGATCIGNGCADCAANCLGEVPVQRIVAPLLGDVLDDFGEAWQSADDCRSGMRDGIRYCSDGRVLYGVIELDEAEFAGDGAASPLQRATEAAYRRLFHLLDDEGCPQLWRVWNYFADINGAGTADGLERYRQFNAGRQDAFLASGRLTQGAVPAACALGVRSGPLTVAFLAGCVAAEALENPRQVSAWDYPPEYGPRAPTFARGARVRLPTQELLFISGTASILGHRSVHLGDAAAQTREAMSNLAAVAAAGDFEPTALDYRVYVRNATDFPAVRSELQRLLGADCRTVYIQADICRADLLVEIEATGARDPARP